MSRDQNAGCSHNVKIDNKPSEQFKYLGTTLTNQHFKQEEIEDRGSTVVKVLCYKSKGRWFDSRWCHWNFSLT